MRLAKAIMSAAVGLAAVLATQSANAAQMSISLSSGTSLENLGSFTGSMQWSYAGQGATHGFLTVSLTNTSSVQGYLTAFALNAPKSGYTYALQAPSAPANLFGMIGGGANPTGTISAAPWGSYVVGASTSNSWLGGGNPSKGLDVGETGTFVFKVSALASLLGGLDATSFFTSPNGKPEFVVRFRGFENGGSDKVTAVQQELTVVPVPVPVAVAAAGLLGVGLLRRRAMPAVRR